jgi:hypothetical protein
MTPFAVLYLYRGSGVPIHHKSYNLESQIFISEVWLKFNIKMRLHDQFQQTWRETLQNCSKTLNYRIFKEMFIF